MCLAFRVQVPRLKAMEQIKCHERHRRRGGLDHLRGMGGFLRKYNKLPLRELFNRLGLKDPAEAVPSAGGEGK